MSLFVTISEKNSKCFSISFLHDSNLVNHLTDLGSFTDLQLSQLTYFGRKVTELACHLI